MIYCAEMEIESILTKERVSQYALEEIQMLIDKIKSMSYQDGQDNCRSEINYANEWSN